ncbi:MAG: peptidase E [Solirubrobacterales bacterium]|nr:peptidase E [Solirubrobacterales bacterium]
MTGVLEPGAAGGERRRILALGGGGFTAAEPSAALDALVLRLTGRPIPKICFLPTASGDQREQVIRFQERFAAWPSQRSVLSLFHLDEAHIDPRAHLMAQDAIYVGGGSMRNLLAIWREHGIDETMREAWEAGIVLAGVSAGAMCWFEGGVSRSGGQLEPVPGLGLVPGSFSVHSDSDPERLRVYVQAVGEQRLGPGYAADDSAAVLFAGTELIACVASRSSARIREVTSLGRDTIQTEMQVGPLEQFAERWVPGLPSRYHDRLALAELRALRAGPHSRRNQAAGASGTRAGS